MVWFVETTLAINIYPYVQIRRPLDSVVQTVVRVLSELFDTLQVTFAL